MNNQRGPVIVFAVLLGAIFLCLCVAASAVAVGRLANFDLGIARPAPELNVPTRLPAQSQPLVAPQAAATPSPQQVIIDIKPGTDVETEILRAVYQKVNPSVVKVISLSELPFEGLPQDLLPQGQGSGFVWDAEGHIVTNAHVVERAREVRVVFYDDTIVSGEVIGADPNSDLAVIEIDPSGLNLVPVERGNIDELQVGDRAIAIGAPFDFAGSMTAGTISALGRSISSLNFQFQIPEVIQTDAPINPGNSGGPLLNSRGQVIGINAQIRSEGDVPANSGVGFAIPIYIAERVVPALIERGRYDHPFIGISGRTYSPEWSEALGFPPDARGAYVTEALAGYPAAKAGIRGADQPTDILLGIDATGEPIYLQAGGDLITAINDRPVRRFDDLLIYLFRYASPGDVVQLTVLHADGTQEVIPVKLGVRP